MRILKIVVTGGPCGGKSTAIDWIRKAFTHRGYTVLSVPETATELITGGVAPWTCGSSFDYQNVQFRLQIEKEKIFSQAARTMAAEKVLIVCDRGIMDNKAYMDDSEFAQLLEFFHTNEDEILNAYDAVFHLVTAAKGAQEFYTLANNAARTETVEEAIALDERLVSAWMGHPHLRVIDNSTDFEGKMTRLINAVSSFLKGQERTMSERQH